VGDRSQPARVRTFTYNSLSQLLTAQNPESGKITYTYDDDGNLRSKTSPAPNPATGFNHDRYHDIHL
jgi:YD repeat-containing protein